MTKFRRMLSLLISSALLFTAPIGCSAAATQLDRGVVYYDLQKTDPSGKPLNVHVVDIDLNDSRVETRLVTAGQSFGKTEKVSSMAKRSHAIAAINGGFFMKGKRQIPTDTLIVDSTIVTKGMRDPAAFGLTASNKAFIDVFTPWTVITSAKDFSQYNVEAINHETGVGIIMYTPVYGTKTGTPASSLEFVIEKKDGKEIITAINHGNSTIPENGYVLSYQGTTSNIAKLALGDEISTVTYYPDKYKDLQQMLACGPILLKNGKLQEPDLTFLEPKLRLRHPRSAVGLTSDNHLLLVAVDGRQKGLSSGMTFPELGKLMQELGVRDAMAMDGGSSTTLYAGDSVVNSPSDGKERAVANAIVVVSQIPVFINGKRVYFDRSPVIKEGRVLVPLREMFEMLGASITWDPVTQTIIATKGNSTVQLTIGVKTALVNGIETTIDVPPVIEKGRTMVPLRFVSTALGSEVNWDNTTETIYINNAAVQP